MLFHFLYPLSESISGLNIFRYITLRSGISFLIATIVSIFLGKSFIIFMKKRQFGQTIRELGPESHFKKTGTPTMGGVVIMTAITVALAISGNFNSYGVCLIFFVAFSYFILGYIDDYIKVIKRDSRGVSAKTKLIWQIVTAVSIGLIIKKFKPDVLAIEDAFFSTNVKSAMVLGHARGSIILAAALNNMTIHEYAPRKVKLSVCGSGAASKEQVSFMVMKILRLEKQLKPYDISDSIAVGLCFINQERLR